VTEGEPDRAPATVLVVDDDESNREIARLALETEGYHVVDASGGAEAIAAFEEHRPECILLDVSMPQMDGFTVCQRIRALPGGSDTTILFFTARRDVEAFDRALRAGGDDFITKPVLPNELIARVETATMLQQLRAEHRRHHELLKEQHLGLMRLQLERERLMAFVVHDLKNPVTSMDMLAQAALGEPGLPEGAATFISRIRGEARQLNRMIMNLLDVSKAAEGKLAAARAPVDLRALVGGVLDEIEPLARRREVTFETSLRAATLTGDADLLHRVLANLVENATKHAPGGTAIAVSCKTSNGSAEFRIADRGVGVPPDMRERIFDAFVQMEGEGRPRTGGGRGLGLTFCKLAVEAHGGQIWVEDAAPGTAFCVSLPRGEAPGDTPRRSGDY
jgi:two-component system sensor histidine kinase/response regulator